MFFDVPFLNATFIIENFAKMALFKFEVWSSKIVIQPHTNLTRASKFGCKTGIRLWIGLSGRMLEKETQFWVGLSIDGWEREGTILLAQGKKRQKGSIFFESLNLLLKTIE